MKAHRYNFLLVLAFVFTLGMTSVFAAGDGDKKSKNDGTLTVKTTPVAYPVRIDGVDRGPSGVGTGREFYLAPGFHTVEVTGPDGHVWKDEIEIRKGAKHCICLKIIEETTTKPCPYRFHLEGPEKITEGDLVTFAAVPDVTSPVPLKYSWRVTPGSVQVKSGLGTPTITVDSTGMGGQTIDAELDVNDDVYDGRCRQVISVPTEITKIPPVDQPKPFRCDEFEASNHDQDKARFDNCVIQLQNTPDAQLYVIIYPGTDRMSQSKNPYDRTSKFMLDYMVKTRGVDPRRISIVKGSSRVKTTFEIWIVPPGATPPVAQ